MRRGCCTLLLSAVLAGHAQAGDLAPDQVDRLDELLRPYVERNDFMGVIGVQSNGQKPAFRTYGFSNLEARERHLPSREFMAGSISKQFTAAAILLLEEDGLLRTTDFVSNHLDNVARGSEISIEQLLTHTAGIVDVFALGSYTVSNESGRKFSEVVDEVARAPLVFEPGARYSYSNGGYVLLAAIVERVSGKPFGVFLHDRLFEPIGLTSTHDGNDHGAGHDSTTGYHPIGRDGLAPYPVASDAYTKGAGSLWTNAADLLAWSEALHTGQILSATSYDKLTKDYGNGYGFGVNVFQRLGQQAIGHDGRLSGFAADLTWYADEQVSIVVLANVESVARDQVRLATAATVFERPYTRPDLPEFAAQTPSLSGLDGAYSFGPGLTVHVRSVGNTLLARANNGSESELVFTEDGAWFSRMLYARVCFEGGTAGRIDGLRWGCNNGAPVGRRLEETSDVAAQD